VIEPAPRFRADFERLDAEERLDDGRWTEAFGEVLLYSRLSQVMFLGRLPARERAAQLITAGAWQLGRLRGRFADVRFLLVILDGAQLNEDGLVTPAIWYTHRWSELSSQLGLGPALSELARFAAEVLGPAATVHDAVGRVYVDL
jgi:hypothetical protein